MTPAATPWPRPAPLLAQGVAARGEAEGDELDPALYGLRFDPRGVTLFEPEGEGTGHWIGAV